jgi:hypothetical protein
MDSTENEDLVVVENFTQQKLNLKFVKMASGFNKKKSHVIVMSFYIRGTGSESAGMLVQTVQREKTTAQLKYFTNNLYKINKSEQQVKLNFLQNDWKDSDLSAVQHYCNNVLQEYFLKNFRNPLINELVYIIKTFLEVHIKDDNPGFVCPGVSLVIDFPNDFLKETYLVNERFPNFYIHKISISSAANKTFNIYYENRRNRKNMKELQKNFSEVKEFCNSFWKHKIVVTRFNPDSDLLDLKYFLNVMINEAPGSKVGPFLRTFHKKQVRICNKLEVGSVRTLKMVRDNRCVGYQLQLSHLDQTNSVSRSKGHFVTLVNHLKLSYFGKLEVDLSIDFERFSDEDYIQEKVNLFITVFKHKPCIEFLVFLDYFSIDTGH